MPSCCVKQCSARKSNNQPTLTFHRVPANEYMKRKWIEIIGSENIKPRLKTLFVCSMHFDETSFNRTLEVVRLRDDAVPSPFLLSTQIRTKSTSELTLDSQPNASAMRTEAQLRKCWCNIKTRNKLVPGVSRSESLESQGGTEDERSNHLADPLMPVKEEETTWVVAPDDDSDATSREFEVAEVSLGSAASPAHSPRLADDEFRISSPLIAQTPESKPDDRCQERIEELHKLKVAEQVWLLKTLRERHATAQLERERAKEDSEKAKLEREKAQFERDMAKFQREKALLELEQAKQVVTEIIYEQN